MNVRHNARLQTANYILFRHLKFVEEHRILLHIMYTQSAWSSRTTAQTGPSGVLWGEKEKDYRAETATCTCLLKCVPITHWQTDRGADSPHRLADAMHKHPTRAWRQRTDWDGASVWQLGWSWAREKKSYGNGGRDGGRYGEREKRSNMIFICPRSATGVWQIPNKKGRKFA